MEIGKFSILLGERFREIRKGTGLNQEEFYSKYLKPISNKRLNKTSSYQGYMTDLENGDVDCPSSYIAKYAEIAQITVSELLDFKESIKGKEPELTYANVAKTIHTLILKSGINQDGNVLMISDPILEYVLKSFGQLDDMRLNGVVNSDVYNHAVDSFLLCFNDRLLGFHEFDLDKQRYDKASKLHFGDIGRAYREVIENPEKLDEIDDHDYEWMKYPPNYNA